MIDNCIALLANIATIITGGVAVFAYGKYRRERHCRRRKLEDYLKQEKLIDRDRGPPNILYLMANLSISEADLLKAAFDSKLVCSRVSTDDRGRSDAILFEYIGADIPVPRKF